MFPYRGEWCFVHAYVLPPHIFASCSWWPLPHSWCSPRQWSSQRVPLRTGWKRGGPLEFAQTRYEQTRRGQQHNGESDTRDGGQHRVRLSREESGEAGAGRGGPGHHHRHHNHNNYDRKVLQQPTNNVDQTFKRRENFCWTLQSSERNSNFQ